MTVLDQTKAKMQQAVEHFKTELKNLRSNRANPAVLEHITVEVYGAHMSIKQLASVTAPEARQLLIAPYDPQTSGAIAKAIENANLNLQPVVENGVIRIHVPPMDEVMRRNIAKQAKEGAEKAKIVIRDIRRKSNETIRQQKADSEITEDQMKKGEKIIQELTDQNCKVIDDLFVAKEKEILTV